MQGYCSCCFEKVVAREAGKTRGGWTTYRCVECQQMLCKCISPTCSNYAQHDEWFCYEHQGGVRFAIVHQRLASPEDYGTIFGPHALGTNYARIGQVTLTSTFVGSGIAYLLPLVAPGAMLGASQGIGMWWGRRFILSRAGGALFGAAAQKAGLAYFGGGALAGGGGGIAAGVTVLTNVIAGAAGVMAGGAAGKAVAKMTDESRIIATETHYIYDAIKFKLERLESATARSHRQRRQRQPRPALITVGQGNDDTARAHWQQLHQRKYQGRDWFHVTWDGSSIDSAVANFQSLLADADTDEPIQGTELIRAAIALLKTWWQALSHAESAGNLLADALRRCDGKWTFDLVAHSLGCRVIEYAMWALRQNPWNAQLSRAISIDRIDLLASVGCNNCDHWAHITDELVHGDAVHVHHSLHDDDIGLLTPRPIGRTGNAQNAAPDGIVLHDATGHVRHHSLPAWLDYLMQGGDTITPRRVKRGRQARQVSIATIEAALKTLFPSETDKEFQAQIVNDEVLKNISEITDTIAVQQFLRRLLDASPSSSTVSLRSSKRSRHCH